MKPRIKIWRNGSGEPIWWCEGLHPKSPENYGLTWAYGETPAIAHKRWIEYWDIPF